MVLNDWVGEYVWQRSDEHGIMGMDGSDGCVILDIGICRRYTPYPHPTGLVQIPRSKGHGYRY